MMYDPDAAPTRPPPQGSRVGQGSSAKGREAAAARRYVQDTIDVIGFLREPLEDVPLERAAQRIGGIAMLEALTLFNDAMQHNPAWAPLDVPEPQLIAAARGRDVAPGLGTSLPVWMRAIAAPANRDHWCRRAFDSADLDIERSYHTVASHAEAAMVLLLEETLTSEGYELAARLKDHPLDLRLLERVRDLRWREFF